MNKNRNSTSKTNKKFTKKNVISAILLVVLLLAAVGAAFGIAAVKNQFHQAMKHAKVNNLSTVTYEQVLSIFNSYLLFNGRK